MRIIPNRLSQAIKGDDLTFTVVLVAAYASALRYMSRPFSNIEIAAQIIVSLLFLFLGIWAFSFCKRKNSVPTSAFYLTIQLCLASLIVYLTRAGLIFLIMMLLIGQIVILLPLRFRQALCFGVLIIMALPVGLRGGFAAGITAGFVYWAEITFVAVFTLTAVRERKARAEIEILAQELSKANLQLR